MSTGPRSRTSHPCIFRTKFVREQVDPRVQSAFESVGRKAPFGDLRQEWRRQHCRTLNPYSSDSCPYPPEDCALAFLAAVERSFDKKSPVGYFRSVAKTMALDRADNKPLERDRAQGSRDPRASNRGPEEGPRMRGADRGPESIGALLRSLDLGPREGPPDDGKASAE